MTDSAKPEAPDKQPEARAEDRTSPNDYGYDFYPERKSEKPEGFFARLSEGRGAADYLKCANNVYWCYRKSEQMVSTLE